MKDITYKITFFSEWHCGSGLTSGSDLDSLVIKDKDKFPFIPGKTLKGLLKEAAEEIIKLQGKEPVNEPFITDFFGFFDDEKQGKSEVHTKGKAFFTDATISPELKSKVTKELTEFFYRDMASTSIGDNGIAKEHLLRKMETTIPTPMAPMEFRKNKEHSLRKMETTIPCELLANIYGVDKKYYEDLTKCLQWIKRLGQNRNRGLGRCKFEIIETKEANQ